MCWSTVFNRKYLHGKWKQGKGGECARGTPWLTLYHQCFTGAIAHTPRTWADPHPNTLSRGEAIIKTDGRNLSRMSASLVTTQNAAKWDWGFLAAQRFSNMCPRNSEVCLDNFHPLHWANRCLQWLTIELLEHLLGVKEHEGGQQGRRGVSPKLLALPQHLLSHVAGQHIA